MENIWLTILLAIFASSGIWSVITLIIQNYFNKRNNIDSDQKKINKMVIGLGHDRITFLGMAYIDRGYITKDEYEDLITYLYKPYKELGGNGTAELVVEKVKALPMHSSMDAVATGKTQIVKYPINPRPYEDIANHPMNFS